MAACDRPVYSSPENYSPGWGLSSEPTEVRQLPGAGWSRIGTAGMRAQGKAGGSRDVGAGQEIEAKARSDLSDDRAEATQH